MRPVQTQLLSGLELYREVILTRMAGARESLWISTANVKEMYIERDGAYGSILDLFAYDRTLVNDELAQLRHRASIEPGVQEAFSAMFPAPRQRWVDDMATDEAAIAALPHDTLIIHGRDDRIIPMDNAVRLLHLIERSQLHVFGRCGHWTQIEHAAEFNQLLLRFLR